MELDSYLALIELAKAGIGPVLLPAGLLALVGEQGTQARPCRDWAARSTWSIGQTASSAIALPAWCRRCKPISGNFRHWAETQEGPICDRALVMGVPAQPNQAKSSGYWLHTSLADITRGDGHQQRLDELHPFLEHQLGAHARPDELPQRHAQPHAPHHLAPRVKKSREAMLEVKLSSLVWAVARAMPKPARATKPMAKTTPCPARRSRHKAHAPAHQQGERHGGEAALALRIAHPGEK